MRGPFWAALVAVSSFLSGSYAIGAETFRDCDLCPLMTVIPPGTFVMGGRANEEGYSILETPTHEVRIAKPFALGVHEVTVAEWRQCVKDEACTEYINLKAENTDDHPAAGLRRSEARKYLVWLNAKTSNRFRFRLPSEAEWEYAARAGTTTAFHFGETISPEQANFDGTMPYGLSSAGIRRANTVPVGSLPPNAFGLYEMHGNVREWVEDCWHDTYVGAPTDGSAWLQPPRQSCPFNVVRGGSYDDTPRVLRSSFRYPARSRDGTSRVGMRVARDVLPFEPGIPSLPYLFPAETPASTP